MDDTNDGGWIKLHRRIRKSTVWQNPNVRTFWVWALLKAAHTEHVVTVGLKRVTLHPGQFLYNHPLASIETGLSQKEVRNCLEFLKNGDAPEIRQAEGSLPGNRYSIVTINNWALYQGDDSGEGRQRAGRGVGKGQARGSLINKEEECKEEERGKNEVIDVTWTGEKLEIPDVLMAKYRGRYPRLDIPSIVLDAEQWLLRNPAKATGYKSFGAFLNNWLRREEEKRRERDSNDDYYEASPEDVALWIEHAKSQQAKEAVNG